MLLMRFVDYINWVFEARFIQKLTNFKCIFFEGLFERIKYSNWVLLCMLKVLFKKINQILKQSLLSFNRIYLRWVERPKLQGKGFCLQSWKVRLYFFVLQMTVVNYRLLARRQRSEVAQEERSVLHRTQTEKIHDHVRGGVEGDAFPLPLSEVVQNHSLLAQGGLREAEFVLLAVACDEVAHLRKAVLADSQLHFLSDSALQIEGQQRTLGGKAFVTECKQWSLLQNTFHLFAKAKQTREIFRVILNDVLNQLWFDLLLN